MNTRKPFFGLMSLMFAFGLEPTWAQKFPQMSESDRECVETELNDYHQRPTREEMKEILNRCGVTPLSPRELLANLSASERQCLLEQIGSPLTRSQRPSREEMVAAFTRCEIDPPALSRGAHSQPSVGDSGYVRIPSRAETR